MEESLKQAKSLIIKSQQVAIIMPPDFDLDTYLAATAIVDGFSNQGKIVKVFSDKTEFQVPGFAGSKLDINSELACYDDLVIRVSSEQAKPGEIRYELKNDGLYVYIKSKENIFQKQDVTVLGKDYQPDLLITIGARDYDHLGKIFKQSPEVFSNTPQINIDINPNNELYGLVNLVQVGYSAICELVLDLLKEINSGALTNKINTSLLAGIIFKTRSLTDYNTAPGTYQKAAQLMSEGADKQSIIKDLYKTKSLPALRLWGRVLARTMSNPTGLLYSTILQADFEKTQSSEQDVVATFYDLVEMASDFTGVVLVVQKTQGTRVLMAIKNNSNSSGLLANLGLKDVQLLPLSKHYNYLDTELDSINFEGFVALLNNAQA